MASITLDTYCEFAWDFGQRFLLKTPDGRHFVWSDPEYNGDNTIKPFQGNPRNFAAPGHGGRDKGSHFVCDYCGPNVTFVGCN